MDTYVVVANAMMMMTMLGGELAVVDLDGVYHLEGPLAGEELRHVLRGKVAHLAEAFALPPLGVELVKLPTSEVIQHHENPPPPLTGDGQGDSELDRSTIVGSFSIEHIRPCMPSLKRFGMAGLAVGGAPME
ncbi:hypothetical protein TYRP_008827 [Tyrophagus putrescentiae]|nr:hypothetical protein TYRP_008827 [Tyrophagus putrescentiae]